MHEPYRPLSGTLEATANTLTASDSNGQIGIALTNGEGELPLPVLGRQGRFVALQRVVAGHGSQADSATHNRIRAGDVFPMSPGRGCSEIFLAARLGH